VIVGHYGLSVEVPRDVKRASLVELMKHDKKAVDGLTFVLDSASGIQTVHDVSERAVHEAFDALSVP
jgi:5-deoxy-5-amino-3-dehydroquinate synthase